MTSHRFSDTSLAPAANPEVPFWRSVIQSWNRFWFTPSDPTLLGLIRICCGLLATYTIVAYTFELQNFFGKHAWLDYELRRRSLYESPILVPPLNWQTAQQLPANLSEEQQKYALDYLAKWKELPPLPFPKNDEEAKEIDRFREYWGYDPRGVYTKGSPEWSVWFHVTDPQTMLLVHSVFIVITFMFTIGLGTRVTSVLAWFIAMSYVHRSAVTLFGVDTMMIILLLYLMVGPSGAALSVDRLIARWWRTRKRSAGSPTETDGTDFDKPRPSVSATVALRMLQIHVCIIYCIAGLAKLQGAAWWQGTAVWGTLANGEFAPVNFGPYVYLLRELSNNLFFLQAFLTFGTYFTLFFEISYPFLIWGKYTRWLILGMAIVLHGVIGLLMGLKTFALMMLVMNMAFLPFPTVHWALGLFKGSRPETGPAERPVSSLPGKTAIRAETVSAATEGGSLSTHVKQQK